MWLSWNDFDRRMMGFNQLFRQFERAMRLPLEAGAPGYLAGANGYISEDDPDRFALTETPEHYSFCVDLPGVKARDVQLDLHDQTLTLTVKRDVKAPEGYAVHRTERASTSWKRSVTLPTQVDSDRTEARFDNGVLTVRVARAAEVQPRRIAVKAS
jgi:HSP20 family protein